MIRRVCLLTLCTMVLLTGAAQAVTTVDPSDPDILYTGRWDFSNSSRPWSYWIGSSITAVFEGTGLAATLQAGSSDYLRIIIDDDALNSTKVATSPTVATYTLATGLSDTEHKIEIIKETDADAWVFHAFELDDGRSLAAPPPRPSRRIAFYGDSNLAGYSLESEQNEGGNDLRGSYHGYAGIASRMLGAEYHNVSRSGATISSLHDVFDRIDYGSALPVWDFGRFAADVVVVNVGANDVGRPEFKIREDYDAFLDDLRAAYPDAHIMLYNAWGWDYDEPANYIHEVIAERDDPNMSSAVFPWIFEQWHGCEYDHAGMARVLADHLTDVQGWNQAASDVMSGYGLNGDVANGSFEVAAPFGGYGWRYYTDTGVSRVHDPLGAHDGAYHLRLADGASTHQPLPATDSETFSLTVWLRGADVGDQVDLTIDFRDQEMWTAPLQTDTETLFLTLDWQRYSMTATAPTGASNPVFHARVTFTAAAGDIVDMDGVAMTMVTPVPDSDPLPVAQRLSVSPNPFNPRARIEFAIPRSGGVLLTVHDLTGRRVATLVDDHYGEGTFVTMWDGRGDNGRDVGSGTYFARMVAGRTTATRKLVLIR